MDPIPIPSQLAAVPPGFDSWWARASSRNPDQRFQSAKDLAETLHLALGLSVAASKEAPSGTFAAVPAPRAGVALRDLKRTMPMDPGLVPRQPLPPPAPPPPEMELELPTPVLPPPVRGPVLSQAEVASAGIAPAGSGEVEKTPARGVGAGRAVVIAAVLVFLALVGLVAVYLLRRR